MNKDINKQLQTVIGNLIGKDYFKLGWGCKVIDDYGEAILNKSYKKMSGSNDLYEGKNSRGNTVITHIKEIIGFEPTLNDVLLAISKNVFFGDTTDYFILNSFGEFFIDTTPYDLKKSLFNQSEETKLAIIKLLE